MNTIALMAILFANNLYPQSHERPTLTYTGYLAGGTEKVIHEVSFLESQVSRQILLGKLTQNAPRGIVLPAGSTMRFVVDHLPSDSFRWLQLWIKTGQQDWQLGDTKLSNSSKQYLTAACPDIIGETTIEVALTTSESPTNSIGSNSTRLIASGTFPALCIGVTNSGKQVSHFWSELRRYLARRDLRSSESPTKGRVAIQVVELIRSEAHLKYSPDESWLSFQSEGQLRADTQNFFLASDLGVINRMGSDCHDYASLTFFILRALGFNVKLLRIRCLRNGIPVQFETTNLVPSGSNQSEAFKFLSHTTVVVSDAPFFGSKPGPKVAESAFKFPGTPNLYDLDWYLANLVPNLPEGSQLVCDELTFLSPIDEHVALSKT